MKVEILIYAYLAICAAMIAFNIVCIFVFRKKDKNIEKRTIDFTDSIVAQLDKPNVDEEHQLFLQKKLNRINHMMAFDETLEKLYMQNPEKIQKYITNLCPVFVFLTFKYSEKNKIQAAYYLYIVKKYQVFKGNRITIVVDALLELVRDTNLYCRENALQALYSIGDVESVIKALKIVDRHSLFHHTKMLTDGLLTFSGDKELLNKRLWQIFDDFSITLKQAILDYFRFGSDMQFEKMLSIMNNQNENQELRFSAIRYFAKYYYEPALTFLYDFATNQSLAWEYRAIAAASLGNYPSDKTKQILKDLLCDRNWHVRYNASESLERLNVSYEEMIDVFEGQDRYASEMIRYRFDRKKATEKEAVKI